MPEQNRRNPPMRRLLIGTLSALAGVLDQSASRAGVSRYQISTWSSRGAAPRKGSTGGVRTKPGPRAGDNTASRTAFFGHATTRPTTQEVRLLGMLTGSNLCVRVACQRPTGAVAAAERQLGLGPTPSLAKLRVPERTEKTDRLRRASCSPAATKFAAFPDTAEWTPRHHPDGALPTRLPRRKMKTGKPL